MKEKLIEEIVKTLKEENEDREYYNENKLDIPYCIVALEQRLDDEKYKEIFETMSKHEWGISYKESSDNEYHMGDDLYIHFWNKTEEDEEFSFYGEEYVNFTYRINLTQDERHWGYCQCDEEDKDYDARYNCCGHGCDWAAPAFNIEKIIQIGSGSYNGDEHSFWDYRDKFNNITVKDKEKLAKAYKIKRLENEIEQLNKELLVLKSK